MTMDLAGTASSRSSDSHSDPSGSAALHPAFRRAGYRRGHKRKGGPSAAPSDSPSPSLSPCGGEEEERGQVFFACSASRTAAWVIGRLRTRAPQALWIALAIAGATTVT